MITDEIRAKIEAGEVLLWCLHWTDQADERRECRDLASHTAVGWREVNTLIVEVQELIRMRTRLHRSLRDRPVLYVWPTAEVVAGDLVPWAEIAAMGPAVGVRLVEGPH